MSSLQADVQAIFQVHFANLVSKGVDRTEAAVEALKVAQVFALSKSPEPPKNQVPSAAAAPAAAQPSSPVHYQEKQAPEARRLKGFEARDLLSTLNDCRVSGEYALLKRMIGSLFSSVEVLTESFTGLESDSHEVDLAPFRLDLEGLETFMDQLHLLDASAGVADCMAFALEGLFGAMKMQSFSVPSVKLFLVLLELRALADPSTETWMKNILRGVVRLSQGLKFQLFLWILDYAGKQRFEQYLMITRQFMTLRIFQGDIDDARVATRFLGLLCDARAMRTDYQAVPFSEFYNDPLNEDYMCSRQGKQQEFSLWAREQAAASRPSTSFMQGLLTAVTPIHCVSYSSSSSTSSSSSSSSSSARRGGGVSSVGLAIEMEASAAAAAESSAMVCEDTTEGGTEGAAAAAASDSDTGVEADVEVEVEVEDESKRPVSVHFSLDNLPRMFILSEKRSFMSFPFVLTPATKASILEIDAAMQMRRGMDQEIQTAMATGQQYVVPYFVLRVSRDRIVTDTLSQVLIFEDTEFKKPLKVIFDEEEGVDAGGVRKEFYQVMCRQLFDPGYGMFKVFSESNLMWFNSDSLESEQEFGLIGLLLGVAIFNSIIIDLKMPLVIYKKLKGYNYKSTLDDLAVLQPSLAAGLRHLLAFEGDVESVFCTTFSITYEVFGENKTIELIEGGSEIPVTNANREEYVKKYVQYLLDVSVDPQFRAFERGFRKVCGGAALELFEPSELELLICGNQVLDFHALRAGTKYADGFTESSQAVQFLWQVLLNDFNDEERRLFLKFVSGSDRSPIDGLFKLDFVISKNGTENDRLPSAHTCFNHLLLPEYSSVEVMRDRLRFAINHSEGFGLR